jgi:hypothetical protein
MLRQRFVWWAALWGVAEGFLFFIVPDVLISFLAQRRGWREAMLGSLAAALGAVLGAFLLWQWSAQSPDTVRLLVETLPGITPGMVERLAAELAQQSLLPTLLIASIVGVPIKIAAMLGPGLDLSLIEFLLVTPLARLPRFVAVGLGVFFLSRLGGRWLSMEKMTLLLALFWIVFYGAFWLL